MARIPRIQIPRTAAGVANITPPCTRWNSHSGKSCRSPLLGSRCSSPLGRCSPNALLQGLYEVDDLRFLFFLRSCQVLAFQFRADQFFDALAVRVLVLCKIE